MERHTPSSSTAFNALPIELNKEILHYLETDQDICNYRLICRQTHDAVDGDRLSFWRARFRETYALIEGTSNLVLKKKYQNRAKQLRRGAVDGFSKEGNSKRELRIMLVLRELIVESYKGDQSSKAGCRNKQMLLNFIVKSRTFLGVRPSKTSSKRPRTKEDLSSMYLTLQIMCAQLLFDVEYKYDLKAFGDSQLAVHSSFEEQPIFLEHKTMVNMDWTLHCLSFFRHHMVKPDVQTLYETMADLDPCDKPSAWRAPLKNGCAPLSKYWKGTYAYLESHELDRIRRTGNAGCYFEDKNVELGGHIQDLELNFATETRPWPALFESHLKSLPKPVKQAQHHTAVPDPAQHLSLRINGQGDDQNDHFYASGWLNPLQPQHGIPGWQRVTLMKHFMEDYDTLDDDLWAYEGVVLPGGRTMLGRWWYATERPDAENYGKYSGPFILWAVDRPSSADTDNKSDD